MASMARRPTFQKGLAHHVAAWRAARLLVIEAFISEKVAVAAAQIWLGMIEDQFGL